VLDVPYLIAPGEWWFGPYLMVGVSAFFAVAVALTARWVGAHRLSIALSGLAGPSIVAAGYLLVGHTDDLASSYLAAVLSASVGLLTSAATAVIPRPGGGARATAAGALTAAATPGPAAPARSQLALGTSQNAGRVIAGQAAPTPNYPPPQPAAQYPGGVPAPAQYSANSYPTNQYPTGPGWPDPRRGQPAAAPVYVAPPRAAPVTPPPVLAPTPPPRIKPSAARPTHPAVAAQPTPPAPAALPEPFAGPPGQPPTRPKSPARKAKAPVAKKVPTTPDLPAAHAVPVAPPAASPAPPVVPPTPPAPAVAPTPTPKKVKHRGKADRTVRVPETTADPKTAAATPPAVAEGGLPRTARPAEVVAVRSSRKSTPSEPERALSRRERRRAAKLAAEQAEEQARLERQLERDAKTMGRREQEHVDWVKDLVNVPVDPTLTSRQK
jgi:hypothetical protein